MDHAIMACGARAAVRGVSAPVQELAYIYKHSGSVALVAEDKNVVERLIASGLEREKIRYVILLYQRDSDVDDVSKLVPGVKVHTFESLLESGDKDRKDGWTPIGNRTDIATILYTSGTTGNPKGVPLTHGNILAQLEDISLGSHDPVPGEVFLSVLPCWHVFERTAAYWTMSKGMHVIYSNKRRFREDLVEHRPQMLISVPRVFENLHAVIMTKLRSASATRRKLFSLFMAISMAFILARRKARGIELRGGTVGNIFAAMQMMLLMPFYALANLLVWKKIRAGLGGKLKIALSGGGSIAGYLEDFFECAGIDICVGYGLTETSPVIANRFGQRNVRGSTGMQLPRSFIKVVDRNTGKRVKRGEQGKLFVTGPYVFDGYLNNPSATREAFDDEGYFDTGDLVYLDEGGDIVISGRSKDLIVLSNGENIEPAPIEDALCSSDLIDQVMLVGQDQRALGALVVPTWDALQDRGVVSDEFRNKVETLVEAQDIPALRALERELDTHGALYKALEAEVRERNMERLNYSGNDRISHIRVLLTPFTVENGMMTQTLKVKKNIVVDHFSEMIASMFQ